MFSKDHDQGKRKSDEESNSSGAESADKDQRNSGQNADVHGSDESDIEDVQGDDTEESKPVKSLAKSLSQSSLGETHRSPLKLKITMSHMRDMFPTLPQDQLTEIIQKTKTEGYLASTGYPVVAASQGSHGGPCSTARQSSALL